MLKKIVVALLILLVGFLALVASRPAAFHVERSLTMKASSGVVFATLNDFHHWGEWSPWDELDPAMKKTFSGPESGVGAHYAWVGNDQVGSGEMTIEESLPNERVVQRLEFKEPFASVAKATFTLAPAGEMTRVTWSFDGTNDFFGKLFSMFVDMDAMIGQDFEKGLGKLKGVTEEKARKAAEAEAAVVEPVAAPVP